MGVPRHPHIRQRAAVYLETLDAIDERLGINKINTGSNHRCTKAGVERVNHTLAHMISMGSNEQQDNWDELLPQVESGYNNSVSASTALAPNEVHLGRIPRLPLSAFCSPNTNGHQILDQDHLTYCDLATERQQRAYRFVREHHAVTASRPARRKYPIMNALRLSLPFTTGGWA